MSSLKFEKSDRHIAIPIDCEQDFAESHFKIKCLSISYLFHSIGVHLHIPPF